MNFENHTGFLPKADGTDRDPAMPDFTKPEVANWAEIADELSQDPELKNEFRDALASVAEKNATKPSTVKILTRISLALGLGYAVWMGARAINEESRPLPDSPSTNELNISPEQEAAVKAMSEYQQTEAAKDALSSDSDAQAPQSTEGLDLPN